MTSTTPATDARALLERLESYYDAAPRSAADVESCGPFSLFVSRGSWPYYARPRLGLDRSVTAEDVRALRSLQVERGVPEQIEWLPSINPTVGPAASAAGLEVKAFPLLVLESPVVPAPPDGIVVRLLGADDASLEDVLAAVHRGFGDHEPEDGADENDREEAESSRINLVRQRIAEGLQCIAAAYGADGKAVGGGSHQPVDDVTELVGIAVVPEARRRGIGAALTAALVEDARSRGSDLIFLSAEGDDVARTYERVGFRRIGEVCAAEPPPSPS